jgi:hypothetical protein
MIQRLGAGVAALALAAALGNTAGAPDLVSPIDLAATCPAGTSAGLAFTRLAARLPQPVSCGLVAQPALASATTVQSSVLVFPFTAGERSDSGSLTLAAVSGQNLTLVEAGSLSPVLARCRLTVSPNPGALVLPNPRNGAVVLVCRNQPRP